MFVLNDILFFIRHFSQLLCSDVLSFWYALALAYLIFMLLFLTNLVMLISDYCLRHVMTFQLSDPSQIIIPFPRYTVKIRSNCYLQMCTLMTGLHSLRVTLRANNFTLGFNIKLMTRKMTLEWCNLANCIVDYMSIVLTQPIKDTETII